ncbi:translation initiation factor IF-3 [Mycoplasma nasistruthionis]|uniref:Translation initiation factor IF-3 n=1 Tax=Mycoplasma nasistruthionis TaxID=353852 RepID=A0A4Y6I619_9MOLU|nr:translation initiation factor IF-3 [Mycoplasma nasistruthionis]QCZ36785.1 translation initiation factor IF-3 [Mycoplasma nasistruthionis]QDF65066.1 translation initiation factor IF-3 [Mycoplasma nasistruthionis]
MQPRGKKPVSEHYVNSDIPYRQVFVIGADGEKIGVMPTRDAIEQAKNQKMDLVLIGVDPKPVCRILDYGKFKYDRKKKNKENKEKQTIIQNREVRLTPMIGENDLMTKSRKAREFILKGDRIKVSLKLRGREIGRKDLGLGTLEKFYATLADIADKTTEPKLVNERFLDMNLQPNKNKIQKYLKEKNLEQNQEAKEGELNAKNEK